MSFSYTNQHFHNILWVDGQSYIPLSRREGDVPGYGDVESYPQNLDVPYPVPVDSHEHKIIGGDVNIL